MWRRSVIAIGACVLSFACTNSVIEMRLQLPDATATAGFDLSCVGAVKVDVIGNVPGDGRSAQVLEQCLDISTNLQGPQGFAGVGNTLRGKFAFDVPSAGLAGVELRGFSGRCSDPPSSTYESVLYGGAPGGTGTTLVLPITPGVSCNTAQRYKIRVLDLVALYASLPTGITCAQPSDPTDLFAGLIRPSMLNSKEPRTIFEFGASLIKTADGKGTLQSFKPITAGPACVAFSYRGTSSIGLTCANTSPPPRGLCGDIDETEIVAVPISSLPPLPGPSDRFGAVMVGAVWETAGTTRAPLAGATVTLADPSQGNVVYVDLGVQAGVSPPRLRPLTPTQGAISTGSGGGFVIYLKGDATNLLVSAPGHVTQTLRIASAPDVIATTIVLLARQ